MRNFQAHRFYIFSLYLLAFSIPIFKYGIQVPIALLVLSWLFAKKKIDRKSLMSILLFGSVYIFHVIAMLYTENVDRGMRDLMQKLSLILFPVIIGTGPVLTAGVRSRGLNYFVLGTIGAVIIGFVSSAIEYASTAGISTFYMSDFSPAHHPSYISFYMVIALAILLSKIEKTDRRREKILLWVGVAFLSLSLIFPASKMGFINWALVFLIFLLKWLLFRPHRWAKAGILTGVGILFVVFLNFDPVASNRVEKAVEVTSEIDQPNKETQIESNTARLYAWSTAMDLIKENPIGVGTGDINDAMVNSFSAQGLDVLAEKNLNPHNEYLQIGLALGFPAALLFLFSLVYPSARILRRQDWIYGIFLLSVIGQFAVESMLEKQSGVIFFAFFNAFFFFSPNASRWE